MRFSLSGWRGPGIVLPLAVALGFALRIAPCARNPGFETMFDGQYHERLTRQVVSSGRLAEVDSLSNAPTGRRTASHLLVGLYAVGAGLHRALAARRLSRTARTAALDAGSRRSRKGRSSARRSSRFAIDGSGTLRILPMLFQETTHLATGGRIQRVSRVTRSPTTAACAGTLI